MVADVNHVRLHLKLVNILTKMCFHIKSGESGMQAAACHSTIAAEEESNSAELKKSCIAALEFTTWNLILPNQEMHRRNPILQNSRIAALASDSAEL